VPVYGKSIGLENHQFAGTDQDRAADLEQQLKNLEVKAIWCVKGGYGSVRILGHLDYSLIQKYPKWLIGYSDVTVLHALFYQQGVKSIHSQMGTNIETRSEATKDTLFGILNGNFSEYTWENDRLNRTGKATGEIVGGNLSILFSLCGSPEALDTTGKILFLEDLDEYLYHIDRIMQNFKRNGMLSSLKGLIIGGMSDMNDNEIPFGKTAEEIIAESVNGFDFPVSFGFPAGHQFENQALVLGKTVTLEVDQESSLLKYS